MRLLSKWIISTLAILLAAYLIPGIGVSGVYIAIIIALLLGLINAVIRPIVVILTLPINIVTLGLFTFIINGFFFWLLSTFIKGFQINGFWTAVLGALVVSIISWTGNQLIDSQQ
jgi:putative membrane protein